MNKLYINILLSTFVIGAAQLNFSMSTRMARQALPATPATIFHNAAKRCCSTTPPSSPKDNEKETSERISTLERNIEKLQQKLDNPLDIKIGASYSNIPDGHIILNFLIKSAVFVCVCQLAFYINALGNKAKKKTQLMQ